VHAGEQAPEGEIVPSIPVQTLDPGKQENQVEETAISPLYLLQEKGRPGEYMPTYEDEHGTYIMNSKDLRAVQHVKRLMEIGIESLKIEGRTKSYYYAARTAQVYRRAIDDAGAGRDFNMGLMDELEGMANRGFTEGFYRRHVPGEYQNYETGNSIASKQLFVADVCKVDRQTRRLSLAVKNKICIGDDLVLLTPAENISFQLQDMFQPDSTEPLRVAPGSGYQVDIVLPELAHNQLATKALDKGLLVRSLPTNG